jgi:hypothetical protein
MTLQYSIFTIHNVLYGKRNNVMLLLCITTVFTIGLRYIKPVSTIWGTVLYYITPLGLIYFVPTVLD